MSVETFTPKKFDPTVSGIVHECTYRDVRIIQTTDQRWVGQADAMGFKLDSGFVVRDEMDDLVLPVPLQWFHSPFEAVNAIEVIHTIMPMEHPATTVLHEYHKMMLLRREFWRTYNALLQIRRECEDARDLDDNPTEKILSIVNLLFQTAHER